MTSPRGLASARGFHVNVNCRDLGRGLGFWEHALGLSPVTRTRPERAQDGEGLGLEHARWDAWILAGAGGIGEGAVDLLEWIEPTTAPGSAPGITDTGFTRVGLFVPSIDDVAARLLANGTPPWSPPRDDTLPGIGTVRSCFASDADGTAVELVEGDGPRLAFVAVTCADRDASVDFYTGLGFTELTRFSVKGDDGAHMGITGPVAMDAVLLMPPGGGGIMLELMRFRAPEPVVGPHRPAHAAGIGRFALLVDDLDAAFVELTDHAIAAYSHPVELDMGPGLPAVRFVCFAGPDHEVIELIERPTAGMP